MVDIEETAQAVDLAAQRMRDGAKELERLAAKMREHKDPHMAAEALGTILNVTSLCRPDLLITRTIRAYERQGSSPT